MTDRLDLNTADAAALTTLPGIGEALAQHIITYRKERGGFTSLQELTAVPGISQSMLETLSEHLFLTVPEARPEATGAVASTAAEADTSAAVEAAAEATAPAPPAAESAVPDQSITRNK